MRVRGYAVTAPVVATASVIVVALVAMAGIILWQTARHPVVRDDWSVQWRKLCESTGGSWVSVALPSGNPCSCGDTRSFDAGRGCVANTVQPNDQVECQQTSDCKLIYSSCDCQAVSNNDPRTSYDEDVICVRNSCMPPTPANAVCQQGKCVRSDQIVAINTSTWKTYRNEQYGFEVKYPLQWEIKEEPVTISASQLVEDASISIATIKPGVATFNQYINSAGSIYVHKGNPALSLLELVKKYGIGDGSLPSNYQYVKVGGNDAISFDVKFEYQRSLLPPEAASYIYIKQGGFLFEISSGGFIHSDNTLLGQFNNLVFTFKFISPASTTSVLDKICNQEQQPVKVSQCGAYYTTYPAAFIVDAGTKMYDENGTYLNVFCGGYQVGSAVEDSRCRALKGCKIVRESCDERSASAEGVFGSVMEGGVGTIPEGSNVPPQAVQSPVVGQVVKVETNAGTLVTSATTDAKGQYRISLPPGSYQICDRPPERACGDSAYKFTVEAGKYFEHNFEYLAP